MDGFGSSDRVVVMAASNLLDKLDPALLRPGRFDRQVFVSPPDVAGRRAILDVHTRNKPLNSVDLGMLARQTSGLSGAELANLCNEAAIRCARRRGHALTQADFDGAFERVVAGVQLAPRAQPARAPRRRLPRGRPRARRRAAARRRPAAPRLDRPARQRPRLRDVAARRGPLPQDAPELVDRIAVLLAGRTAEQLVFGEVTTGAANDLQRVAEITHAMVHHYAMGSAATPQRAVLDVDAVSDITRRIRDEEQRELAYEGHSLAQSLIHTHRQKLDELARALLDREALDRRDLDRILGEARKLRVAAVTAESAAS